MHVSQADDPDFTTLLQRCRELYDDLKNKPIMNQERRTLRKKNLSFRLQKLANQVTKTLLMELNVNDRSNLDYLNTIVYCVAVTFTYKEGQEYITKGKEKKDKPDKPAWMTRITRNIARMRKEADILNECVNGNLKKR